jgi:hypothetical protein
MFNLIRTVMFLAGYRYSSKPFLSASKNHLHFKLSLSTYRSVSWWRSLPEPETKKYPIHAPDQNAATNFHKENNYRLIFGDNSISPGGGGGGGNVPEVRKVDARALPFDILISFTRRA